MSSIFDLPAVHQTDLVCEWFELADVARLDSALCCKKFRADFLALICCPQSVFAEYTFEHDTSAALWVIKRNVKIKSIHVFADILTDDELYLELFLSLACPALECVTLTTYLNIDCEPDSEENITVGAELCIIVMLSSSPNLKRFYIESKTQHVDIREELLVKLLTRCKKLRTIELQNCYCGSNAFMHALYTAPSLETIVLTGGRTKQDILRDTALNLVNNKVSQLCFEYFDFPPGNASIISQICGHFPNLVTLEATDVTNAHLVAIAQHCPLLQEVRLCVVNTIEKDSALQAARNWPHLRKLGLHLTVEPLPVWDEEEEELLFGKSCSESALLCFIRHCPQLTYLSTVSRSAAYTEGYWELTAGDKSSAESQLYELFVDSLSIGAFHQIKILCKRLHLLAIHHEIPYLYENEVEDVSARPLETALHCINKSSVKILHLHNYCDLSGVNFKGLANLLELSFSGASSRKLCEKDVLKLAARCPNLRKLDLKNCFPVYENFLVPLLDRCRALTSLSIVNRRKEGQYMRHTSSVRMLHTLVRRVYPQLLHFSVDCNNFS